jgi:hypothetical protein
MGQHVLQSIAGLTLSLDASLITPVPFHHHTPFSKSLGYPKSELFLPSISFFFTHITFLYPYVSILYVPELEHEMQVK